MHVIVMPEVSQALGAFLPRPMLVAVLNRLYDQLGSSYERYQPRRTPGHADDCFDYLLNLCDADGRWLTIRFTVNDRQAAGHLFVVAVSQRGGRLRWPW